MGYCSFTVTVIILEYKHHAKHIKGDRWSDEVVKRYWGTYVRILSLYIQCTTYKANLLYND